MNDSEHEQLAKIVKRSLNKRRVNRTFMAKRLKEQGHDISENYLAQIAYGRIKKPDLEKLLIISKYFNGGVE